MCLEYTSRSFRQALLPQRLQRRIWETESLRDGEYDPLSLCRRCHLLVGFFCRHAWRSVNLIHIIFEIGTYDEAADLGTFAVAGKLTLAMKLSTIPKIAYG